MPPVSRAQNRFMQAHKDDAGKLGEVAREFTADLKPGGVKKLPERASKRARGPHEAPLRGVPRYRGLAKRMK
jgi:hypothetical protein